MTDKQGTSFTMTKGPENKPNFQKHSICKNLVADEDKNAKKKYYDNLKRKAYY